MPEFAVCFHRDGAVQCWPQSCVFYFLISCLGPSIIFALVCHGLSFGLRTLLGEKGIRASVPCSCFGPLSLHSEVVFLIQVVRVAKISGRKTLGTVGFGSLRQVKMLRFEVIEFCP